VLDRLHNRVLMFRPLTGYVVSMRQVAVIGELGMEVIV
jgi:hypothetical protein